MIQKGPGLQSLLSVSAKGGSDIIIVSAPEEYPLGTEVTGAASQVAETVELPIQIHKAP